MQSELKAISCKQAHIQNASNYKCIKTSSKAKQKKDAYNVNNKKTTNLQNRYIAKQ